MKKSLFALFFLFAHFSLSAAVILQYHHVSETSPKSTSITPSQFQAHLQYLADNHFNVVPLSDVIEAIKVQTPLKDKTVAITFDDAYLDILTNAKPLLDKFNFPYTIFVNPGVVNRASKNNLSWAQLKAMADEGVIIANHGFEHDSLARVPDGMSEQQWLTQQGELLLSSEKLIEEKTGQSWRYFAYPYGEYTPRIQQWVDEHGFIAFSQQSGATGLNTDLTSIPRFPASMPYDKISSLRDKLNSLPFAISLSEEAGKTIYQQNQATEITIDVVVDDFYKSQLNCYISGLGRQKIHWQGDDSFNMNFSQPLPTGRVRSNCTAPSISKPGRYYWYSKPWFILKTDGSWYPL